MEAFVDREAQIRRRPVPDCWVQCARWAKPRQKTYSEDEGTTHDVVENKGSRRKATIFMKTKVLSHSTHYTKENTAA